jgi:hypothetical protein
MLLAYEVTWRMLLPYYVGGAFSVCAGILLARLLCWAWAKKL